MGTRNTLAYESHQTETDENSLSEAAQPKSSEFFEVSKVVESMEMLEPWVGWFRRLDIPCIIEKRRHGYILWRRGVEIGGTKAESLSELRERKLVSCFGV